MLISSYAPSLDDLDHYDEIIYERNWFMTILHYFLASLSIIIVLFTMTKLADMYSASMGLFGIGVIVFFSLTSGFLIATCIQPLSLDQSWVSLVTGSLSAAACAGSTWLSFHLDTDIALHAFVLLGSLIIGIAFPFFFITIGQFSHPRRRLGSLFRPFYFKSHTELQ